MSAEHSHQLVPVYSPQLFRSTAEFYARFRPRYPTVLIEAIERAVSIGPDMPLLDLACGTGQVSLAFADRVADIWAIDLEPEMVAEGQRQAGQRGISRIHWLAGRAEDAQLPEDHFGIVAIGRAFHRLNRPLVAQHQPALAAQRRLLHRHGRRFVGSVQTQRTLASCRCRGVRALAAPSAQDS